MIIWHVGGGGGGYGKAQELAEKYRAETRFVIFEANAERCETNFPDEIVNTALGDESRVRSFYVYERTSCSSFFEINHAHAGEITRDGCPWGDCGPVRETREMDVRTIDDIIGCPDLLSLDAQGSEYSILKGAIGRLPYILAVLTEFQTAEVYKGQGLFHDQAKLLHEQGFRLADIIYKEFWTRDGTRLLTAGDALFLNFNKLPPERVTTRDEIASFFGLKP